ncbi:MAG TPA: helical backbone metal receptor [Flavipsychrobacter sp.]|nr:helical backbone metal receptor [Flavipsychrobacter sp.]
MMGRKVEVNYPPKRIVSIVPSQTELLFDLGLDEEVMGITKFCVHPESWFRNKTRVGGTKQLHIDKIRELQPDLIIANKEENTQGQVEELAKEFPVWISDIQTVAEGRQMIAAVGELTGKQQEAQQIIKEIESNFATLRQAAEPKRVAYFIWREPWMSVGHDTFISNMIETIGWANVFADRGRYPEISAEHLLAVKPEMVLLSSEPFPFKEKHIEEVKAVLPDAEVLLVDGEMFSWYGSRMRLAPGYMGRFLNRDLGD